MRTKATLLAEEAVAVVAKGIVVAASRTDSAWRRWCRQNAATDDDVVLVVGQADEDQRDAAAGVGLSRAKHGGSAREGGRDRGRGQDGSDDFVDEVELDGVDVVEVVLVGVVEDMAAVIAVDRL